MYMMRLRIFSEHIPDNQALTPMYCVEAMAARILDRYRRSKAGGELT